MKTIPFSPLDPQYGWILEHLRRFPDGGPCPHDCSGCECEEGYPVPDTMVRDGVEPAAEAGDALAGADAGGEVREIRT